MKTLFYIISAVAMIGTASAQTVVGVEDSGAINNGGANQNYDYTALTSYDASAASKLVVTISTEEGFGDTLPSGVSFGGFSFAPAISANNGIRNVYIWYLDATDAGGTFGTGDLLIEGSGDNDFAGSFLSLSNTADGIAGSNSAASNSVTIDTTIDGSIVVAAHTNNGSGTASAPQSPLTSILNSDVGSSSGGAGYVITNPAVTGGTYSFSGSTNSPITAAAVFTPVPEPSSFALIAGCLGLTWVMLRRRA